ncbi:hypothetical protein [Nocardia sp. NPDC046763]|uniref:hypothetical protein n=1 Tax=Nocardia sp. NPDC046763 TaxID=3155256 RepID=UPI0034067742
MLRLIFFAPVVCWLLMARSAALRIRLGLLLFAIAAVQVAVTHGLVMAAEPITVLAGLAITVIVVLLCGWIFDEPGRSGRAMIGIALSLAWSLFTMLVVLVTAVASTLGLFGSGHPKDDVLLPLPSGLVVLKDDDSYCGGTAVTYCYREFWIGGSAMIPDADVFTHVLDHIRSRGWSLDYDENYQEWHGCRVTGWWLDRLHSCVEVYSPWTGASQTNRVLTRGTRSEPPARIVFDNHDRD